MLKCVESIATDEGFLTYKFRPGFKYNEEKLFKLLPKKVRQEIEEAGGINPTIDRKGNVTELEVAEEYVKYVENFLEGEKHEQNEG